MVRSPTRTRGRRSIMENEPERSRQGILFQVWLRMESEEADHPERPLATVLELRRSRPEAPIADLAREFGARVGSPVSPDRFRALLMQARRRFLALLGEQGYHSGNLPE